MNKDIIYKAECHSCHGQALDSDWWENAFNLGEWMKYRTCEKCSRTWLGFAFDKGGEVKWYVWVGMEQLKEVLGLSDGEIKGH